MGLQPVRQWLDLGVHKVLRSSLLSVSCNPVQESDLSGYEQQAGGKYMTCTHLSFDPSHPRFGSFFRRL